MNSIIIALCLVLASVQLSYQQSPASIFDAAETGALELSNVNLAGQSGPLTVSFTKSLSAGETIEAKVSASGTFSVNVVNKDNKDLNGLHVSLRAGCCVVLNWYSKADQWDYSKESRPNLATPAAGEYTILIHASTSNVWKLAINGAQASYPVNIAFDQLNAVTFTDSVKVNSVRHLGRFAGSPLAGLQTGKSSFRVSQFQSVTSANPVNFPALSVGSVAILKVVPADASSLNFYNQASNKELNALHMSFRFASNKVVFNFHTKFNTWDYSKELRLSAAPALVKDVEHTIQFVCSPSGWIVSVNGKEFARYPANIACDKADQLGIVGGTRVTSAVVYA